MLIYCPKELREIYVENELKYTNRVVNLSHVSVIGTSYNSSNVYLPELYSIRFSHNKNHSTEWMFANKEDRDNVFDTILLRYVDSIDMDDLPLKR